MGRLGSRRRLADHGLRCLPATKNAPHTTGAKSAKHAKRKAHGAVGTIAAIAGDTWTLHAASGATVTVKLSSTTAFGTKKTPSTASSFAVGDKVGALGHPLRRHRHGDPGRPPPAARAHGQADARADRRHLITRGAGVLSPYERGWSTPSYRLK